jgi:hypothetical protein
MNPMLGPLHRHPSLDGNTPNGHVVVDAEDWQKARAILEVLGHDWPTIQHRWDSIMRHVTFGAEHFIQRPKLDSNPGAFRSAYPILLNETEDVDLQMARAQIPPPPQPPDDRLYGPGSIPLPPNKPYDVYVPTKDSGPCLECRGYGGWHLADCSRGQRGTVPG